MKLRRIHDPNSSLSYTILTIEDFEYANPVSYMGEILFNSALTPQIDFLEKKGMKVTPFIMRILRSRALNSAKKEVKKIHETPVPKELFLLLNDTPKRLQEKHLRNVALNFSSFMNFIFKAYKEYGFTLSQYKSYHDHEGADVSNLPLAAEKKDDGTIEIIGDTNLSDGQVKNLIDQRKVKVAKFLDKEDEWHCFFLTYKSLAGDERGEQSHMHYISDKWGLSREHVLKELQSKKYSLPSLPHINYKRHD